MGSALDEAHGKEADRHRRAEEHQRLAARERFGFAHQAVQVAALDRDGELLQAVGRARIFGSTSAGMALPAAAVPLPSGDRLMYPTADFVDPLKRRIEGVGVVPDQPIAPTPASLSKGADPVLDAAVAWTGAGS